MNTSYNRIAGQNIDRLAALSDGIFAVAMTLLVLDLHSPAKEIIHSEGELWHALTTIAPQLVSYLMSFLTLGIFWNGQQVQFNHLSRGDRHFSWIQIAFLFAVSVMPFSTRLLAEFITFRIALLCYWANILLLGMILYAGWRYARHAGLLKPDLSLDIQCAVERRILIAQALYAVGASLCAINTYLSILSIVLIQLNFAIAPRIRWISKA